MINNLRQQYHDKIKAELDGCINFWLDFGMDKKHGGIYTCLDKNGEIYSSDKSVWMQGRAAWIFSHLCNTYGAKEQWLLAAKSCLDFMDAHCFNESGSSRMLFSVTNDGRPLRQRRYFYSEQFYTIACAEYYLQTKNSGYLLKAQNSFENIYKWCFQGVEDPVGMGPKTNEKTRELRSFGPPMIYLNTCLIMYRCDEENSLYYLRKAVEMADIILNCHYKKELACTLENCGPKGEYYNNISAGRHLNPGHAIEGAWFIMRLAEILDSGKMASKAMEMYENAFESGWDKKYGGLLYFTDSENKPIETCEHDMKLWWPQNELAIAASRAYMLDGSKKHLERLDMVLDYSFAHFSDGGKSEWFGCLHRDGTKTEPAAKGSSFKGPFHLPRMLITLDKFFENTRQE